MNNFDAQELAEAQQAADWGMNPVEVHQIITARRLQSQADYDIIRPETGRRNAS